MAQIWALEEGEEESNNGLIIRGGAQSRVAYSLFSRPSWNTRQSVKVLVESPWRAYSWSAHPPLWISRNAKRRQLSTKQYVYRRCVASNRNRNFVSLFAVHSISFLHFSRKILSRICKRRCTNIYYSSSFIKLEINRNWAYVNFIERSSRELRS